MATIKHHAHPEFEIDQPGKDTWRHYQAGADQVIIVSPIKMAVIRRLNATPPLADLIADVRHVDIILVEGFSRDCSTPKIELVRAARSTDPINAPADVLAYVSDLPLEGAPCFGLDDLKGLADMLEERYLSTRRENMSLPEVYTRIREEFPGVADAYDALGDAAYKSGPLDAKTASLIKLAMALGAGLEGAAHSHVRRALQNGASPAEIKQVVVLAITTLGWPRATAAYSWINDVLDET